MILPFAMRVTWTRRRRPLRFFVAAVVGTVLPGACAPPETKNEGKKAAAPTVSTAHADEILRRSLEKQQEKDFFYQKYEKPENEAREAEPGPDLWRNLFDGATLTGWKKIAFGGEGKPHVKDGALILPSGDTLTGVVRTEDLPEASYAIELEAMRVEGTDIFCGLTFPVGGASVSLILGGWGGGVCGISSIEGMDASENETTSYQRFENGRWYAVRVRVTHGRVEAWVEREKIVDLQVKGRKLDTRWEMSPAKPMGLASWQTTAALRNLRWRPLP